MINAASIVAIIVSAIFAIQIGCRKEKSAPSLYLAIALGLAAFLEFFDMLALIKPEQLMIWKRFSLPLEALIPALWLWFSVTYARPKESRTVSMPVRLLLMAAPILTVCTIFIPLDFFIYSPDFKSEKVLFLGNIGLVFYLLIVVYLVIALINLETILSQATLTSRWKIKYELLGSGVFLTILMLYYSQGLLYRSINMYLVPARSLVLIVAISMIAYSRFTRDNGVKVYVSRQMAYQSVVLFFVGIYVVGLGLVGIGMKHFGGGFQIALKFSLILLAGLGLIIILVSESVKRKIKVFIHKNFYKNKYDYRNQWLQFTDRLSLSLTGDELLNSILMGFCDTFGMGDASLFLLNKEREIFYQPVRVLMPPNSITFDVNEPMIEYLSRSKLIIYLRDENTTSLNLKQQEFFKGLEARFIIPLFINEILEGFVVLGKPLNQNETYNYEDFDLMRTLAKQTSSTLLNQRLSDQLTRSREMAAIGKISAFVIHDLKNLVSALSLMLDNAQDYITLPVFQKELLSSLRNTVSKMNALVSRLKYLPEKNSLQRSSVDLLQLVRDTASQIKWRDFRIVGNKVIVDVDRDEIQKVALNLMLNAVEATKGEKPVTVEVGESEVPYFRVKDEGCGIPENFLHYAMFTPFTSSKKKGLGIGLYQSKQIVEAHGGKIDVESIIEKGSKFTVWLPRVQPGTS